MKERSERRGLWLGTGLTILVVPTAIAAGTGLWMLTAIPVGFLFGFFLQKGDLCGASALSEVILFRDRRKIFGSWVAGLALAAWPSSAASGRNLPLGVTHGVYDVEVLLFESGLVHVYRKAPPPPVPAGPAAAPAIPFTICTVLANWVVTWFYLMGGGLHRSA